MFVGFFFDADISGYIELFMWAGLSPFLMALDFLLGYYSLLPVLFATLLSDGFYDIMNRHIFIRTNGMERSLLSTGPRHPRNGRMRFGQMLRSGLRMRFNITVSLKRE